MKIVLITKVPFPNGMAATKRVIAYAKAWIAQKIDCEVIIYTRTEIYGKQPNNILGNGKYQEIPFKYLKGTPLREKNVVYRQVNDILDRIRLKNYLKKILSPGDVVYEYGQNLYTSQLIKLVHSKEARYYCEMCEYPFGTDIETPTTIRKRKKYEKSVLPYIDGVIAISDALVSYSRLHCGPDAQISKIPILVDFPEYDIPDKSDEAPYPYIFHSGTLFEQKDGFVSLLKAFAKSIPSLPDNAKFISTGSVSGTRHETEIYELIERFGLKERVIFTGFLSNGDLRSYLSKALFVVINKLPTQQNKYCFSTKLGEYMAASKPVIITNVGEATNWLTSGVDSLIIEPGNEKELSEAIIEMFNNPQLRKRLSDNARTTCLKSFDIKQNAEALKEAICL